MERADELAPLINAAVAAFYANRVSEGVSAFQAKLLKVIMENGLSEHKYVNAMKSGVHPDGNSEITSEVSAGVAADVARATRRRAAAPPTRTT